ncbi:MAG: hypothetical protein KIT31_05225 [Deltaproteobacteria bacterium]|nr:hypothetical protein [Deltaproteobacteria bacterium]
MEELINVIRSAVASDANNEQKAAGAQACRTILAALDTEPGNPMKLPGTPSPSPGGRLSIDQVLDLAIARLTTIANERAAMPVPPPAQHGLRVPVQQAQLRLGAERGAKATSATKAPTTTRKP